MYQRKKRPGTHLCVCKLYGTGFSLDRPVGLLRTRDLACPQLPQRRMGAGKNLRGLVS